MSLKTETKNGYTLTLDLDDFADESPREYEESTFFGFHRRVISPDPAPHTDPERARAIAMAPENICLPVFMYDHGARIYKASADGNPFHCTWDSGLFGFIYIARADARRMYGIGRITETWRKKILADLAAQVSTYSQWANGELYRWTIEDADGAHVASCGGYYDADEAWTGGAAELPQEVRTDQDFDEDGYVPIIEGPDGAPVYNPPA